MEYVRKRWEPLSPKAKLLSGALGVLTLLGIGIGIGRATAPGGSLSRSNTITVSALGICPANENLDGGYIKEQEPDGSWVGGYAVLKAVPGHQNQGRLSKAFDVTHGLGPVAISLECNNRPKKTAPGQWDHNDPTVAFDYTGPVVVTGNDAPATPGRPGTGTFDGSSSVELEALNPAKAA